MKVKMKPETIERRRREHAAERIRMRADLRARLAAKAQDDPSGIWADLLTEHDANNAD